MIGKHLIVGNHNASRNSQLRKAHPVLQRAEIVPDVQPAGRTVARQHPVFFRIDLNVFFKIFAALKRCCIRISHNRPAPEPC